jgi:hypothetical protein
MKITPNAPFREKLLKQIAEREFKERTGVHCSDLIYCPQKQAFRRLYPESPSDDDLLLFSLGWATQRWLTGELEDEVPIEQDGIIVTMDCMDGDNPWELKCTFQSSERPIEENIGWIRQIMAQCHVAQTSQAYLSRLCVMGNWKSVFGKKEDKSLPENRKPTLGAYLLEFTPQELEANWNWLIKRRELFLKVLESGMPLARRQVLEQDEWQCARCTFNGNRCPV